MMNFEQKIKVAPESQKERYTRIINRLADIDLSDQEKRILLWIASNDDDTELAITNIFEKLKCSKVVS